MEMLRLAEHRAEPSHLPHEPLHHLAPRAPVRRDEATRLFGQVNEDRTRLEHRDRCAVRTFVVDDRRHLVVRIERKIIRIELRAAGNVDRMHRVRHADLFEHDLDLVTVRRGPCVQFDHRRPFWFSGEPTVWIDATATPAVAHGGDHAVRISCSASSRTIASRMMNF
jgi:hypothetical protein